MDHTLRSCELWITLGSCWGVSEMRIDYGPGYCVYYTQRESALVLLLCGGDKRTQGADIKQAIAIVKDWKG